MKVLIVDENPGSRLYTSKAFEESGIPYEAVDSAAKARGALQDGDGCPFDVVLLDRDASDGDSAGSSKGSQLLTSLREEGISIPVILVSVRESLRDRVQGLNVGADDYIVKPFEHSELVARVRAVLRRCGKTSRSTGA